jgi:NAD(P)H dehydrogenase (quinone)
MNILVVYAHHEPSSFVAALKNITEEELTLQGHQVVISDLYAQGFNPVADKYDFTTLSGHHFNYMLQQQYAVQHNMGFAPDIVGEMQKVQNAQMILWIFPLWWSGMPAIIKGWFDRVFAMGFAWDTDKEFIKGLLRTKTGMIVTCGGYQAEEYSVDGPQKITIETALQPINHNILAYSGMNVLEPFVAMNIFGLNDDSRQKLLEEYRYKMQNITTSPAYLSFY